ncbi:Condensin complex subunit 2 [Penicillium angulare]|uniref:Condensin complex subunit 2 n=1 Tax=Penicillium angulare TaxID=116970 RepID=A0A9W9EUS3_9EURO|nr:Condensin complex subunit 2 [Penicillium angulare]
MPRVANKIHRRSNGNSTPHKNTPVKIPLNDDMGEKAARMEARQAQYDRQMSQIKAAVKTPMPPRRYTHNRDGSESPGTPRGSNHRGRESDVNGRAVTPMKRVPILANFEEWMKMATDNKINANNSWNFALIDYFHDMSLLKEGDGVNFQKASCTLDGCVKIYTSRVDSVATETGKLLSGLADSRDKRSRDADAEGEDGEEDEEGEDGAPRKSRKKTRSHEATLAASFSSLQLKKFELEFAVDPLFKKASADFDEGGAKGLLLNHLAIDGLGRIVFDSSDDAVDDSAKTAEGDDQRESVDPESQAEDGQDVKQPAPQATSDTFDNEDIDLATLATQFFPDLDRLAEQDVCPSLKNFDLGDPTGSLDIPLLKAPEDWRQDKNMEGGGEDPSGIMLDDDNAVGFDDDDASLAGFDLSGDTGFGDGGEVWAREAALEPMLKVHRLEDGEDADGDEDMDHDASYAVSMSHQPTKQDHENILSYFDNALQKNWAGPEHWKIRRIKDHTAASTANSAPKQRKEKEPFEIDFGAPLDHSIAELIYTPAISNSAICLPKTQWKTKGRNLLPDDKHFNSRNLLRLFLKPKAHIGSKKLWGKRTARQPEQASGNGEMDEAFWANHKVEDNADDEGVAGAYDANFFADDDGLAFPNGMDLDDEDDNLPFADAREMLSPPTDGAPGTSAGDGSQTGLTALLNMVGATPGRPGAGGYGSQLVTQGGRRARPDYVNYARVAKKVDVRRLKTEMWKGMGERLIAATDFSSASQPGAVSSDPPAEPESEAEAPEPPTPTDDSPEQSEQPEQSKNDERLRFTQIMNSLKAVYPAETLRDISTSFGFICLLHLANEQGLVLESDISKIASGACTLEEIFVSRDVHAVLEEGGM